MNLLKTITGIALICATGTTYAQGCAGHANAGKATGYDMATLSKELKFTAEQEATFTRALSVCQKECSAMGTASTTEDAEILTKRKSERFNETVLTMSKVLDKDQYSKLEAMHKSGQLAGLCGTGATGKGCASGAAKGGCCAGKAGAKATKADEQKAPVIQ